MHNNKSIHLKWIVPLPDILSILTTRHHPLPSAEPSGKLKSPSSRSLWWNNYPPTPHYVVPHCPNTDWNPAIKLSIISSHAGDSGSRPQLFTIITTECYRLGSNHTMDMAPLSLLQSAHDSTKTGPWPTSRHKSLSSAFRAKIKHESSLCIELRWLRWVELCFDFCKCCRKWGL